MQESISLYQLNRQVAQAISAQFRTPVWITAEIARLGLAGRGHCYLELIEKQPQTGATLARASATIWASHWPLISATFERGTGQQLGAGIKVLVQVQVSMHPEYGYSLNIVNIDPSYTLGEIQRIRMEILQRLRDEGMLDANRSLLLPRLTQRIAVISSATAAGYGDFCHQLEHNEYGVRLYTHLFPALVQGQQTEQSVIAALTKVYEYADLFDVVVIIRGGGAVSDLNCFDSYPLAAHVANFPLPVIVGIGHERDSTVLDVVAHTSVKTPTAAAALLIDRLAGELAQLEQWQHDVTDLSRGRIEREMLRVERLTNAVRSSHLTLGQQQNRLSLLRDQIKLLLHARMEREKQRQEYLERSIEVVQPANILRRGFSITRQNGQSIKSASGIEPGSIIETETADGTLRSVVQ
ncbi:MAG: exodeoxyribonuclease VII large subunit [Bacteroidales bacterium]|nr:exodeoxyribonuclease VII large subunit [Bacteroidales bacterium]